MPGTVLQLIVNPKKEFFAREKAKARPSSHFAQSKDGNFCRLT